MDARLGPGPARRDLRKHRRQPRLAIGRTWTLVGADGKPYPSPRRGTLGGHRGTRIYGRLDCASALRTIARGGYVKQRVFFLDERTARAAGYRPCAVCMPEKYRAWKKSTGRKNRSVKTARRG